MYLLFPICIIALMFVLWIIIRIVGIAISHKGNSRPYIKEWLKNFFYLNNTSERGLFLKFMGFEVGLAGIAPYLVTVAVKYKNIEIEGLIIFSQNSEWVSISIGLVIAIGYYLYLWKTNRFSPENLRELTRAASLINETFAFAPNQKWFEAQNGNGIKLLDKRFSRKHNFHFKDMDFALASLHTKDDFKPLLQKELNDFDKALMSFVQGVSNKSEYKDAVDSCITLSSKISGLDGTVEVYEELLSSLVDFLYDKDSPLSHIKSSEDPHLGYLGDKVSQTGYKLRQSLKNEWITYKKYHTLLITGGAGMGKSHLIGDIVSHRLDTHEPSILLLGQQFTSSPEALSQICSLLDVKCKKDTFLSGLDKYGESIGVPVVIFIDGINEGAGENLWMNFFDALKIEVEKRDNLRLVVSFRTSDRKNWFYDMAHNPQNAVYHHKGFMGNEREACEYIFSSFNLDQPLWPVYGSEFSNPLFLTLYCRSHELSGKPLDFTDFWTTIIEYCVAINHELSIKYGYNGCQNLVTLALDEVAKLVVSKGRWRLTYPSVMEKITKVAQFTKNPTELMEYLINEGLLRTDTHTDATYVYFGYERIGDYFIAKNLINNISSGKWLDYRWGDLSEALSVLAPALTGKELIELVNDDEREKAFNCFLMSSKCRDSFCAKGHELLNKILDAHQYPLIFEIILSRPFRSDNWANGATLYEILWNMSISQRDEIWTTYISNESEGQKLLELAKWGCKASSPSIVALNETTANLCVETLVWALASTWGELRDSATHAIVNLITAHTALIKPLLEKFYQINDPYIQERVWCVVYGALMLTQDKNLTCEIADWVYQNIFISHHVPEHVLMRDYARDIILYAKECGLEKEIDNKLINVPFSDGVLPDDIPSSEEITAKYERDWDTLNKQEQKEYCAVLHILSSMAPEYCSRTTSYGDFGRYVFQSNIQDLGEDVEQMSNWGIQMIFEEFGYDAKVFASFDCGKVGRSRLYSGVERIGKKYQWIAMYRIMARLMDRHPSIKVNEILGDHISRVRKIDPTIYPGSEGGEKSKYEVPAYDVSEPKDDIKWMKSWMDMPHIKEYVISRDSGGVEWVNLFSYNNIVREPEYRGGCKRDLWTFIQAYVVDKKNLKKVYKNLYKYGTEGRSFHENKDIYKVFSREFYWSPAYNDATKDGYSQIKFKVGNREFERIIIKPAYLQYHLESVSDGSTEEGVSLLLPNKWLYEELELSFSRDAGVWVNKDKEIVVVDNHFFSNAHSALLVRKDVLLKYLNGKGERMFWPILNERMIWADEKGARSEQNGGYAYMDSKGKIHQRLKCYEPSYLHKTYIQGKSKVANKAKESILWLHKHHLLWLPMRAKMKLYYDLDYDFFESLGE